MQVVFFNINDQSSYPVEVDDAIGTDIQNIKLMCNGEIYDLVNTVPDEIKKLNKLREDFEAGEFDRLAKDVFKYQKKEDVPDNFLELFKIELNSIEASGKYKDFFESITESKDAVIKTLSNHFLTFAFMLHRFHEINEENRKSMMDVSFAKDYAARYKKLFSRAYWENKKTLKELGEEVDQVRRFMDIDERRHAGKDTILKGIGNIAPLLSSALAGADLDHVGDIKINKADSTYGKLFESIYTAFDKVYEYYEDFIKRTDNTILKLKDNPDSKHIIYLRLLKPIIAKFLTDTDNYLKDASKIENDDKSQLKMIKDTYITNLKEYFDNLDSVYTLYDSDNRIVDSEEEKQFLAVWDSSIYYRSSVSMGDWFVQLARLLYKSYNDLFSEILTEDEKVKDGDPVK